MFGCLVCHSNTTLIISSCFPRHFVNAASSHPHSGYHGTHPAARMRHRCQLLLHFFSSAILGYKGKTMLNTLHGVVRWAMKICLLLGFVGAFVILRKRVLVTILKMFFNVVELC